ncbi:MAG: hypothetical protein LUD72_03105 [Bacteroidales bacterium]|nr:hypothetical protein [Bacteroidales bacterium]
MIALVTYEIDDDERIYKLISKARTIGNTETMTSTAFFLKTELNARLVYNVLMSGLQPDDIFFVTELERPHWHGRIRHENLRWLLDKEEKVVGNEIFSSENEVVNKDLSIFV